jgi:hypothetical protein
LFFSEQEYRDELYEKDDEDDGAIITQLEKLNADFLTEKHFIYRDNTSLTERFLTLRDRDNKFMTTRFTITTIIAGEGYCSICKEEIAEFTQGQVHLPCNHKFHINCLVKYMVEIQACPVCHIFIHLKNGKILNPYNDIYPNADESLVMYVQKPKDRLLPHASERTIRYKKSKEDINLNKKDYVLAIDSYIIYPKEQCLYYWFSKEQQPIVACAVRFDLQRMLLSPFWQKRGDWKHVLNIKRKLKSWDGVSSLESYFGNIDEDMFAEDVDLTLLVYGKPILYDGVYELKLHNREIEGYHEIDMKKASIDYEDDNDVKNKMKENKLVFEFLYNYDQTITDPCCVVSFQYDPKLGVAMVVIIY